jgi:HAD superfamily hydrolase (TIGR01509 family)
MIAMSVSGVIFDLGSTLIHRTGLELEREKCTALAALARSEWGCRDAPALAARLLEIRLDGWRRSEEELVERLATESIAKVFQEMNLPTDAATLHRAERAFFEPEVRISRLYPGALKTLDALRGMGLRLAMISNATSHQLILDITAKHGIGAYFDPLLTSAGFGLVKPHPSIFTQVLDAWQTAAASVVMVGDTLGADVLGARTVGMRSILVDIEPNPANPAFADSTRPTERVTSLEEIPSLLKRWAAAP